MVWAKLDDNYPDNPKIVALSDAAFRMHTSSICYSAKHLLNGLIPKRAAHRYATKGPATARELLASGLFIEEGPCYRIHDFLDYNPTAEQVAATREARAKAGRLGGLSKAASNPQANGQANALANGQQNPAPYPVPVPDALGDLETSQTALAKRLNAVCKRPDEIDAMIVVTELTRHIDERLIDECIGWAEQRDEKKRPGSPRYFLTVISDWARQRGVVVPQLDPQGLVG